MSAFLDNHKICSHKGGLSSELSLSSIKNRSYLQKCQLSNKNSIDPPKLDIIELDCTFRWYASNCIKSYYFLRVAFFLKHPVIQKLSEEWFTFWSIFMYVFVTFKTEFIGVIFFPFCIINLYKLILGHLSAIHC